MNRNEYGPLKRIMVCPPDHLNISSPINVIAARHNDGQGIDVAGTREEHDLFVRCLEENGIEVLKPQTYERFSYQINVRDLGVASPKGIIWGRLLRPERWGEHRPAENLLEKMGLPVFHKMDRGLFEGGDFMFLDEKTAAVGLGARTDKLGFRVLETLLYDADLELIPVNFPEEFLHLDMICNVIADRVALIYPEAVPVAFLRRLRQKKFALIEVSQEEVFQHSCNLLNLGREKIISHPGAARVNELLTSLGLEIEALPLQEVLKSGGGPRCMSLPLQRE